MFSGGRVMDRARSQELPAQGPTLDYLGESHILRFSITLTLPPRRRGVHIGELAGPNLPSQKGRYPRARPQERQRVYGWQEAQEGQAHVEAESAPSEQVVYPSNYFPAVTLCTPENA